MRHINSRIITTLILAAVTSTIASCGDSSDTQVDSNDSLFNAAPAASTSEVAQAKIQEVTAPIAPIKNMDLVVGNYSQLSSSQNNQLKGLAQFAGKAWTDFESMLNKIQSGAPIEIQMPELQEKYGVSSIMVDKKALALWLNALNDSQKKIIKEVITIERSVADNGVIDVSSMAVTCSKVTDFSTLVEGINKASGAACMLAIANVLIPGGDEAVACGLFGINKKAAEAATVMETTCQLLPLQPKVLKVYFGKPCLKTISDINPAADQTTIETRAIFSNNLDKAQVLKLLIDKGIKKVTDSMKLAQIPQQFIDTVAGDLSKNISELLTKTGSAFGLNLDTPIDAISGDGPIASKYLKWNIPNPIVEIKDNKAYSASSRGKVNIAAQIVNWPTPLSADVTSLPFPYRVSAPPILSNVSSAGIILKCKNSMLFDYVKIGDFSIHDDDADITTIDILNKSGASVAGVDYYFYDYGPHADVSGYLTEDQIFKTSGSAALSIRVKDLCENIVTFKDVITVTWTEGESLCAATHDVLLPFLKITSGNDMPNLKLCPRTWGWPFSIKSCESKHGGYPAPNCYEWGWACQK